MPVENHYDVVMIFNVLVLQRLYNVSDDQTEYQAKNRCSFCRFLGLTPSDRIPDAKTIWLFREQLVEHALMKALFLDFNEQINRQGYQEQQGKIVDASFVAVPRQRNNKQENKQIKKGEIPARFNENPHVGSRKNTDARWAKKNDEVHFGYKNHTSADNDHKLIRDYKVTSSEVHDSRGFEKIPAENTSKDVWADGAYRSEAHESSLENKGYRSYAHKKAAETNRCPSETKRRTSENQTSGWKLNMSSGQ